MTTNHQQTNQPTDGYEGSQGSWTLNPDPVFKFLWIRIRFQPPDPGAKKECRKGSKSYLLEGNIKIMTKDRQKLKKATIFKTEVSDPDPVNITPDPNPCLCVVERQEGMY